VPEFAKEGDEIRVVEGAESRFVLRWGDEGRKMKGGCYLVGDCYVEKDGVGKGRMTVGGK